MSAQHEPTVETRAQVKALAQYLTQAQIADFLEISIKTLVKHYRDELDRGAVRADLNVVKNLYAFASGAKGGEKAQVTAAIFWAKTRMGWRETVDHNVHHSFVDGARERLAGKLGGAISAERAQGETALAAPVGRA